MKNVKTVLKDKRGIAAMVGTAVMILAFFMSLALFQSYFSVYSKQSAINATASEIARHVQVNGQVTSETYAEFNRLKDAYGIPEATISFSQEGQIQLQEPFSVTVSMTRRWGIGGIKIVPTTVAATQTGRSEVYWK